MDKVLQTQELEYSIDLNSPIEKEEKGSEEFNNVFDTQELTYSLDLSSGDEKKFSSTEIESDDFSGSSSSSIESEWSDDGESSPSEEQSDDDSFPELSFLKPYDFEPLVDLDENENDLSNPKANEQGEPSRIGNTNWCKCGNCKPMDSEAESLCCLDTNEVPDEYFEGNTCIILSEGFSTVCLSKHTLKTALSALNDLRGDSIKTDRNNCSYRYAGYKQFTWWVHNNLGKGVRKVIPSCSVWAIRTKYPSEDSKYAPFMEYEEEERRVLEE